jgi:hypothetical protein
LLRSLMPDFDATYSIRFPGLLSNLARLQITTTEDLIHSGRIIALLFVPIFV